MHYFNIRAWYEYYFKSLWYIDIISNGFNSRFRNYEFNCLTFNKSSSRFTHLLPKNNQKQPRPGLFDLCQYVVSLAG